MLILMIEKMIILILMRLLIIFKNLETSGVVYAAASEEHPEVRNFKLSLTI